jgi:hypothetical protein
VDPNGHLTGALGVAIMARKSGADGDFAFGIADMEFTTRGVECGRCANNCEIICIHQGGRLLDAWGNKCERGTVIR